MLSINVLKLNGLPQARGFGDNFYSHVSASCSAVDLLLIYTVEIHVIQPLYLVRKHSKSCKDNILFYRDKQLL